MPECVRGAFDLNDDAVGVVADHPGKVLFGGDAIDEWPEADTLDHSSNPDAFSLVLGIGCLHRNQITSDLAVQHS